MKKIILLSFCVGLLAFVGCTKDSGVFPVGTVWEYSEGLPPLAQERMTIEFSADRFKATRTVVVLGQEKSEVVSEGPYTYTEPKIIATIKGASDKDVQIVGTFNQDKSTLSLEGSTMVYKRK